VLVEEVCLCVQEAPVVEPDFYLVSPQESDQFLDQLQRGLIEWLGLQVALEPLLQCLSVGSKADIYTRMRLCPQQQSKGPDLVKTFLHQAVARDGEVGRGDIERLTGALPQ